MLLKEISTRKSVARLILHYIVGEDFELRFLAIKIPTHPLHKRHIIITTKAIPPK